MKVQTGLDPNPANMAFEPTPGTVHARERSRSPRRHEEEPFGLSSVHLSHQFGFRDATLWCWKSCGWSAGSRRASRLKDPCGIPTKTGADVVYRVSGGYPPKAHEWRSDDVSGAPQLIPSSRIPTATDTDHKFSFKTTVPSKLDMFRQFCWSSADQGMVWLLGAVFSGGCCAFFVSARKMSIHDDRNCHSPDCFSLLPSL